MSLSEYLLPSQVEAFPGKDAKEALKCFPLNIQSAKNKAGDLDLFLNQFSFAFDIIILSETRYGTDHNAFSLPTYDNYFLNRTPTRGGGMC